MVLFCLCGSILIHLWTSKGDRNEDDVCLCFLAIHNFFILISIDFRHPIISEFLNFIGIGIVVRYLSTFSDILILFIFVCDDGDLTGFGFADDSVVNVLKLLG